MGRKVDAITSFLGDLKQIRQSVKDDGILLLQKIDLKTLADKQTLSDFLFEMAEALMEKHLVRGGKVQPSVASAVRKYVSGMSRRKT